MELDQIKKIWTESDLFKLQSQVSDSKVVEMLKNEGKTALAKLIRLEKISVIFLIPLGIFFCLISYKFFQAGGYYMILPLLFLLFTILAEPFEIYLYRLLRGIDFSSMTVKEVSERILKYQNIVQKSQMYGMIFFIPCLGTWYYMFYKLSHGLEIFWPIIILMIFMCIAGLIAIPVLYKKLYFNNIDRIKKSLEELKEFEEE